MTRTLSALALLTLTACGSSVQPLSGDYIIRTATLGTDTCGLGEDADVEGETMSLTVVEDQIDVMIGDEGDGVGFDCELDGDDLVCDDFVQDQDVGGDEGDAVITLSWALGGTFADESTLEDVQLALDYSCAGADCATFAANADVELPCQTVLTIAASI